MKNPNLENILASVLDLAKLSGATSCEASVGTGSGFSVTARMGEAETVEHFARLQPAEHVDSLLRDVSEHGIRATKRDDRDAPEKHAELHEHVFGSEREREDADRQPPDRAPQQDGRQGLHHARPLVRACRFGVCRVL